MKYLLALLGLMFVVTHSSKGQSVTIVQEECVQEGTVVKFECVIEDPEGHGATIWRGSSSIFDCPTPNTLTNNRLFLRHSLLTARDPVVSKCGNVSAELHNNIINGTVYNSTITITTTQQMNGLIQCTDQQGQARENIRLEVEAIPHPPILAVSFPTNQTFIVSWTSEGTQSTTAYTADTSDLADCGTCETDNLDELSCSNWSVIGQVCNVTITAIVDECGTLASLQSSLPVLLNYPEPPTVQNVLPLYNAQTGRLLELNISLQGPFDGNNLPINYSVNAKAESMNAHCSEKGFANVFCGKHLCEMSVLYNIEDNCQLPLSEVHLQVLTSSDNIIGRSQIIQTYPVLIATKNNIMEVKVQTAAEDVFVIIHFSEQSYYSGQVSARIKYGDKCSGLGTERHISGLNQSTLTFTIPSTDADFKCYIVTADNGSQTISIQGSYTAQRSTEDTLGTTVLIIFCVTLSLVVATAGFLVFCIICRRKQRQQLPIRQRTDSARL